VEREVGAAAIRIDPEHARSRRGAKSGRELSHEAEPDHEDPIPDRDLAQADRMERDRGERGEARVVHGDAVRDGNGEVLWNGNDLGVARRRAAACHRHACVEAVTALTRIENRPRERVAERLRRREPLRDFAIRGQHAFRANGVEDLRDLIGAAACLVERRCRGQLDLGALGPGGTWPSRPRAR
jgi:hypothetical protein